MLKDENSVHPLSSQTVMSFTMAIAGALVLSWAIIRGDWVYLALLIVVAAFPVAVHWPVQASLGIYAFLIPLDPVLALGGETTGPTLTKLVGVVAAATLLATGLTERRFVRPPQVALWWSLFILWGALSAVWAVDAETVLDRLPMAVSLLVLYLVVVSVDVSKKELFSVYLFIILGGIVASACTIYLYQAGVFFYKSGRASLMIGGREANPNTLSFSLLLPIALAFYSYTMSLQFWKKIFYLMAIIVLGTGFFLTMSRGPLLGLVISLIMYSIFSYSSKKFILPLVFFALLLTMMPETFFERLNLLDDPTGAGRVGIWQDSWSLMQDYWILGAGLDNYPIVEHERVGIWKSAHNIYLTSLVELGIIGFSLLLVALWSSFRKVRGIAIAIQNEFSLGDEWLQAEHVLKAVGLGLLAAAFFQDVIWRKAFWLQWMLMNLIRHSGRWGAEKVTIP